MAITHASAALAVFRPCLSFEVLTKSYDDGHHFVLPIRSSPSSNRRQRARRLGEVRLVTTGKGSLLMGVAHCYFAQGLPWLIPVMRRPRRCIHSFIHSGLHDAIPVVGFPILYALPAAHSLTLSEGHMAARTVPVNLAHQMPGIASAISAARVHFLTLVPIAGGEGPHSWDDSSSQSKSCQTSLGK